MSAHAHTYIFIYPHAFLYAHIDVHMNYSHACMHTWAHTLKNTHMLAYTSSPNTILCIHIPTPTEAFKQSA